MVLVDEQDDPLPAARYRALAEAVLAGEGVPPDTAVAVHLVTPERIAELNAAHLGRPGATDVLSFPLEDLTPGAPPPAAGDGPPLHLGDVVLCPRVVRERAGGGGFDDQMALLVVHGILHLLGYDHEDDADAELMEAREQALLAGFAPS